MAKATPKNKPIKKQPDIVRKTGSKPVSKSVPMKKVANMQNPISKKTMEPKPTDKKPEPVMFAAAAPASRQDLSTVIEDANFRKQVPPVYPRRALELGQQDNIILHVLVKPDGLPSKLRIIKSSDHFLLDKAALAAMHKWEFEPTNENGRARHPLGAYAD